MRILLLCLILCPALHALSLVDQEHGFKAEIPESLPQARVDASRFPDTLHMYAEPERGGAILQFVLLPEELRQGASAMGEERATSVFWKGFSLSRKHRYISPGTAHAIVEISVEVPVAKRGIRIALTGSPKRETELIGTFMFVLERFEAATNWKNAQDAAGSRLPPPPSGGAPVAEPAAEEGSDLKAALAVTISLAIGFAVGWWLRGAGNKPAAVAATLVMQELPPVKVVAPVPVVEKKEAPKRAPDETDPGTAAAKCRVCGVALKAGRKTCLNCGSEVY